MISLEYRANLINGNLRNAIDTLRWMSALAVCMAHERNLLFPRFSEIRHVQISDLVFYFFTQFGTQAVNIFFVISGLLGGGKIISGMTNRNFSISNYAIDRLSRLYVVLIPALILSVALSKFAVVGNCTETALQIAGNAIFLQNVAVQPLCNNHPLWSLANEGFYYLLAGLIALIVIRKSAIFSAILLGSTVAALTFSPYVDYRNVLICAPIWCFGIAPWFVRVRLPYYIAAIPLLVVILLSRAQLLNYYVSEYAIGLTLTFMLCSDWQSRIPSGSWAAGFSYSLYLTHMPILQAAFAFVGVMSPHSGLSYAIYLLLLLATILVAWLFGRVFEDNTHPIRSWITCQIRNESAKPSGQRF